MTDTDRTSNRELLRRELIADLAAGGTELAEAEAVADQTLDLLGKLALRIDLPNVLAAALPQTAHDRREDTVADVLRRDRAALDRSVEAGVMTQDQADRALETIEAALAQAVDGLSRAE